LQIQYTGAQASCLLIGDATAKTLTAQIGAAGAEAVDAAFGTAGVLDLTAGTVDTLEELKSIIDAYGTYSATILYGDDIPTESILDQTVQAKGGPSYVLFTITSVLSATALTTWSRVREAQTHLKDADQIFVERLINSVTETAEAIAERPLKARALSEDLDGSGREKLRLPVYPIISVTAVYVDSSRVFGANTEVEEDEAFVVYGAEGMLSWLGGAWPVGRKNVRVLWNGGLSPVADRLQFAAIEVVAWNLQRFRGAGGIGLKSAKVDEWDYSYELDIPLSARRVFESFRSGV
jgi:hypothetical protein